MKKGHNYSFLSNLRCVSRLIKFRAKCRRKIKKLLSKKEGANLLLHQNKNRAENV